MPTQHPLRITKCIYYLFLNQNTHTHHIDDLSFRTTKKIPEKILKVRGFIRAGSSRFGPLRLLTILVGTPGGICYSLSGSDGYHNDVGTPPLSIASDTRHSSHHRPHQCRTLARSTAHRTQSPVHSSAKGIAQLHIKGVLTLSFPQENIPHTHLRTAIRVIKATTPRIAVVMTAIMGRREVGAVPLPRLFYPFAGVYLC